MGIQEKKERLKQLINAILILGGQMPKVKLAKLILLCDREHYKKTGKSITGLYYVRLEYGPVVAFYDEVLEEGIGNLWDKEEVYIQIWSQACMRPQYNFKAKQKMEIDNKVQKTIAQVVKKYGKKTGTQLSEITHKLPACKYSELYDPVHIAELSVDTDKQYFALLDLIEEMDEQEEEELAMQISQLIPGMSEGS